jgi:hypothetical protein
MPWPFISCIFAFTPHCVAGSLSLVSAEVVGPAQCFRCRRSRRKNVTPMQSESVTTAPPLAMPAIAAAVEINGVGEGVND